MPRLRSAPVTSAALASSVVLASYSSPSPLGAPSAPSTWHRSSTDSAYRPAFSRARPRARYTPATVAGVTRAAAAPPPVTNATALS